MIGHHALIGATSRVSGAASAWHPTDEAVIIEYGDATTMRDAGGSVPSEGEVVETWLSSGSVGTLTMTRAAGAPVLALSNGRPYIALPTLASNGIIYSFTSKDLVGTELWVLLRKQSPSVVNMLSDNGGAGGTQYQFKAGANLTIQGSSVVYSPTPLVPLSQTNWVIGRAQFRADGGFLEIDGAGRDTFTGSQAAFDVGAMGRRLSAEIPQFHIAAYATVFGTADSALEANLYAYLGAERDALNGV
jgi:hypothetical protein